MRNATRLISPPTKKVYRNADEIARWLRITKNYVTILANAKIISYAKNADGDITSKFILFDVVGEYIAYLNSKRKEKPVSQTELDQARIERIRGQSERDQIQNMALIGKLAFLDDVDSVVTEMLVATRTKLLGLPAHVTRLLLGKESYDEVCNILTEEIEHCLSELHPIDRNEIRSRNQKLKGYTDIANDFDDAGKGEEDNKI